MKKLVILTLLFAALVARGQQPPSTDQNSGPIEPPKIGNPSRPGGKITGAHAKPSKAEQEVAAKDRKAKVANIKKQTQDAANNIPQSFSAHVERVSQAVKSPDATPQLRQAYALLRQAGGDINRTAVYEANVKALVAMNSRSGSELAFGVNDFTHLTDAEFKQIYISGFPSQQRRQLKQTVWCNKQTTFPFGSVTPPAYVDWKTAGYVTPVRNQGGCGSCAAFSAIGAAEPAFIAKWGNNGYTASNVDLSEQELLDCTSGDQCQGAWPHWYMDRIACNGVLPESADPYRAVDNNVCPTTQRYAAGMTGWSYVPSSETGYAQAINHSPISIAVQAGNSIFRNYAVGVVGCDYLNTYVDHAVVLTGYMNGYLLSNGSSINVYNLKNSWGTSWGDSGYMTIRKDCAGRGALAIYDYAIVPNRDVAPPTSPPPPMSPPPPPPSPQSSAPAPAPDGVSPSPAPVPSPPLPSPSPSNLSPSNLPPINATILTATSLPFTSNSFSLSTATTEALPTFYASRCPLTNSRLTSTQYTKGVYQLSGVSNVKNLQVDLCDPSGNFDSLMAVITCSAGTCKCVENDDSCGLMSKVTARQMNGPTYVVVTTYFSDSNVGDYKIKLTAV